MFEVIGKIPNIYQCHCRLCRKATGSSANAATLVHESNFRWVSGLELIASFSKETGFQSSFCSRCGSPVPNKIVEAGMIWVPAGLLGEELDSKVSVHLFLASSAKWEKESGRCVRLDEAPSNLGSLYNLLQRKNTS
ncbi:GFA family protein [Halomonas beimenensis]|uniref:GFA family protein n=1 Tax=Halomonas beimenensis TaxID=475662 RepID=UPI001D0DE4A1|nr:GFA family protein [Halomonas beimenensis]